MRQWPTYHLALEERRREFTLCYLLQGERMREAKARRTVGSIAVDWGARSFNADGELNITYDTYLQSKQGE